MNKTNKTNWINKEKKHEQKGFCQVDDVKKIQLKKTIK